MTKDSGHTWNIGHMEDCPLWHWIFAPPTDWLNHAKPIPFSTQTHSPS
jgi:hypothetical protein